MNGPRDLAPRRVAALVAAAGLALAGCAGIPDDGPVTKVATETGPDQSTVRYSPTGPTRDATPQQIVRGYLDAMLAFPVTTGTAASFLTPDAARDWDSSAGVAVYSEPRVSSPDAREKEKGSDQPTVEIDLDVVEKARLTTQSRFKPVNASRQFTYRLRLTDGQWRITNPQPGFLVNRKFFDDYYRAFDAFYFDRPGKRLVADPIYLPVGDQLSTALVNNLLMGPNGLLGKTARTYVPKETRLRTSVPSRDDGLADVQFRDDLNGLPGREQERLSAQVVWTLRQVDLVSGVRITGGDNVLYPGNRGIQSVDSWAKFGPRYPEGGFYALQKGRVVEVSDAEVDPVDGPWGVSAQRAVDLAVDAGRIAAVRDGRRVLSIGSFEDGAVASFTGQNFLRPLWDDEGNVWAIDRPGDESRLRIFSDAKFRAIPIGTLARFRLDSFALSPDGGRYAAVASDGATAQVYVGSVQRNADDAVVSLGDPQGIVAEDATFTRPRSVRWASASDVTFLADDNVAGNQVFEARIDGSSATGGTASTGALLPDVDARSLVTTGGDEPTRYVTDTRDRVWWLRPGASWSLLDATGIDALTASTADPTG